MCRVFIHPMLEFIDDSDPGKNGDYSFQLIFFGTLQFFFIVKKSIPEIHAEQFHTHACHLCNFHWIFLKRGKLQGMCKKRMYSMPTLMNDCRNITHLAGCIHENKWSTCFRQRTVVSSRGFSFPAFKV